MAIDVPGVFYVGDAHVQGGATGVAGINAVVKEDLDNLTLGISATPTSNLVYLADKKVMQVTPQSISTGASMSVASGAHIWYDYAAMSGVPFRVASATTTKVTLPAAEAISGIHAGKLLSFINNDNLLFSGVFFDQRVVCTGNTDQVFFYNAVTNAPTVAQSFWAGEGLFTDYHPAAGYLLTSELIGGIAKRGGSSPQQGGHGVGADATMVPDFFNKVWNTAPYFHFYKYATTVGITAGWSDAAPSARASLLTELDRVTVAAAERGNTIKWEVAIIDFSMTDLSTGGVGALFTYRTDLEEMIAWLRSASGLNNPDLKIILINHRSDMWATTGSLGGVLGAPLYRGYHRVVAGADPNVSIVDMEGKRVGAPNDGVTAEHKFYSQSEYFWMGEEIVRTYQRMALGTPDDQTGGFPLYMYFGDSIATGEILESWTLNSNSPDLSGENPPSLLRSSNQLIYNRGSSVLEIYKPHTNSNTSGSGSSTASSEISIFAELSRKHPNGFGIIKRGSGGSALYGSFAPFSGITGLEVGGTWLSANNEHYPELQNDYAGCLSYINSTLGKQADLRGIFVSLGHNDAASGYGSEFASSLITFCNDIQNDFNTRTDGTLCPIIWRRPQVGAGGVDINEIAYVRGAIESLSNSQYWFKYVDCDDLERDNVDNLHETPETAVVVGRRMVAALSGIIF